MHNGLFILLKDVVNYLAVLAKTFTNGFSKQGLKISVNHFFPPRIFFAGAIL